MSKGKTYAAVKVTLNVPIDFELLKIRNQRGSRKGAQILKGAKRRMLPEQQEIANLLSGER